MRGLLIVLLAAVVVAACGRAPQTGPGPGGYRLYEAVSTHSGPLVDIVDSRTHTTLGVLPLGTPSADWKHYYAVRGGILEDLDPRSGAVLHSFTLARPYNVPPVAMNGMPGGLSQNGRWLVLQTPGQPHLLVVDTSFARQPVAVDLDGSFEFDGISNDGGRLFLLQYVSVNDYKVRYYDVNANYLNPYVVVDKFDPTEPMTGRRLATVYSTDGQWQFTVYARAKKGAFIHALMMGGPISLCFDLPGSGWETDPSAFRWSLALSPDGTHMYAANGPMGLVVDFQAGGQNSPAILRTHTVPRQGSQAGIVQKVDAQELGSGGAVVSPDGNILAMAGDMGVEWIDTSAVRPISHGLDSWRIWSLAMSPDGEALYALRDSGEIAELATRAGGGVVTETFDPGLGQPMALMRVEAP